MNKYWVAIVLSLLCIASTGYAEPDPKPLPKTIVAHEEAKLKLLGAHKLSLQWISWDYFGTATAVDKDGVISLKGEQRTKTGGDYLTVDGVVTAIDKSQFTFNGSIVTRVSYINNGEACVRQGDFTFRITGSRKYWRLQEMDSPCGPETDYVDIYFRK